MTTKHELIHELKKSEITCYKSWTLDKIITSGIEGVESKINDLNRIININRNPDLWDFSSEPWYVSNPYVLKRSYIINGVKIEVVMKIDTALVRRHYYAEILKNGERKNFSTVNAALRYLEDLKDRLVDYLEEANALDLRRKKSALLKSEMIINTIEI